SFRGFYLTLQGRYWSRASSPVSEKPVATTTRYPIGSRKATRLVLLANSFGLRRPPIRRSAQAEFHGGSAVASSAARLAVAQPSVSEAGWVSTSSPFRRAR